MKRNKIDKVECHLLTVEESLVQLDSSRSGISEQTASQRLSEFGPNRLPEKKPDSLFAIFFRQFKSPLIYILLGASLAILISGEKVDAVVILAVLIINAAVGSFQEGRAQNTLRALNKFSKTEANVLRDGRQIIISDELLVPGDIVVLKEGQKVPADGRVLESSNLTLNEAALTGESLPVYKDTTALSNNKKYEHAELTNMVIQGTLVVAGFGKFLVVTTGSSTLLGQVSASIAGVERHTPLQNKLNKLTNIMIWVVLAASVILFIAGLGQNRGVEEMFKVAIAMAVSIIPEGLPVAITLILATGVWRMGKRRALVKKLPAVEALGQADVIAVDKTGTITKNELMASVVVLSESEFTVTGNGFEPSGGIFLKNKSFAIKPQSELESLLLAASLSSNAEIVFDETDRLWKVTGDPTDGALAVLGQKLGFDPAKLKSQYPMVRDWPFDYKVKYHAATYKFAEKYLTIAVGAPESIFALCKNPKTLKSWDEKISTLAKTGLRVLAVAQKLDGIPSKDKPEELEMLGLIAMSDQLKEGVKDSVQTLHAAGIRIVMLTGDNKHTATAIAKQAGIFKKGDLVVTGKDLDSLSPESLLEKLSSISVIARVTPEHKMKIIQLYSRSGKIIGMTGDGVNDASSLVAADIGLAMGQRGTDVAKEAADIILLDDNFDNIVSAVEEGRNIIQTIKKVLVYLFSTSIGELFTIVFAMLLALPLPLQAVHIIWLNFVTDGFLTVALGLSAKEDGLITSRWPKPSSYILNFAQAGRSIYLGLLMAILALGVFVVNRNDIVYAQTLCVTVLAMVQWYNAWNCRSLEKSAFKPQKMHNWHLPLATTLVIVLHVLAVQTSVGNYLLKTTPLSWTEWAWLIALSSSVLWIEELRKLLWPYLRKTLKPSY